MAPSPHTRKYACDGCGVGMAQSTDSAEMCAKVERCYDKADALSEWNKVWGCFRCCFCRKEKEGWSQLYFEKKGCQQCNDRHPKPEEEEAAEPEA